MKRTFSLSGTLALIYFGLSFINWSFSPDEWGWFSRTILTLFGVGYFIFVIDIIKTKISK